MANKGGGGTPSLNFACTSIPRRRSLSILGTIVKVCVTFFSVLGGQLSRFRGRLSAFRPPAEFAPPLGCSTTPSHRSASTVCWFTRETSDPESIRASNCRPLMVTDMCGRGRNLIRGLVRGSRPRKPLLLTRFPDADDTRRSTHHPCRTGSRISRLGVGNGPACAPAAAPATLDFVIGGGDGRSRFLALPNLPLFSLYILELFRSGLQLGDASNIVHAYVCLVLRCMFS